MYTYNCIRSILKESIAFEFRMLCLTKKKKKSYAMTKTDTTNIFLACLKNICILLTNGLATRETMTDANARYL